MGESEKNKLTFTDDILIKGDEFDISPVPEMQDPTLCKT